MRSTRYFLPVGVAGLIAIGTAIPTLASASAATPALSALSAQQLIVKAEQAKVAGLSGTVKWSPNLGLPDLSSLTSGDGQSVSSGGFDPTSLLTTGYRFKVWAAGPTKQRIALAPSSLTEVDVVRNGNQLWTSNSSTQKVTHYVAASHTGSHDPAAPAEPAGTPPTPQQAADRLLAAITRTTKVSVVRPVFVAGRPTYELRLVPRVKDSTVGSATIAIDSATGLPLRVEITPKGSKAPALSLGYTSISFSVPSASNFAPLVGTSSVTKTVGGHGGAHHGAAHPGAPAVDQPSHGHAPAIGAGWGTIATFHTHSLAGPSAKELDAASSAVTLPGGSTARLVTTTLLNALVLPDGTVLAGFVTPSALEAAAASAG
jgi:outer membrane lipoprotein-sorting protein